MKCRVSSCSSCLFYFLPISCMNMDGTKGMGAVFTRRLLWELKAGGNIGTSKTMDCEWAVAILVCMRCDVQGYGICFGYF